MFGQYVLAPRENYSCLVSLLSVLHSAVVVEVCEENCDEEVSDREQRVYKKQEPSLHQGVPIVIYVNDEVCIYSCDERFKDD